MPGASGRCAALFGPAALGGAGLWLLGSICPHGCWRVARPGPRQVRAAGGRDSCWGLCGPLSRRPNGQREKVARAGEKEKRESLENSKGGMTKDYPLDHPWCG